jgi:hypothetical protein
MAPIVQNWRSELMRAHSRRFLTMMGKSPATRPLPALRTRLARHPGASVSQDRDRDAEKFEFAPARSGPAPL